MSDDVPIDIRAPWGKASGGIHRLILHAIDAGVFAEAVCDRLLGPRLQEQLKEAFTPLKGDWRKWVALWCALHDLGKFSPVFQAYAPHAAEGHFDPKMLDEIGEWAKDKRKDVDRRHALISANHMYDELKALGARKETVDLLTDALASHHGFAPVGDIVRQVARKAMGSKPWKLGRRAFVRELAALWGLDFDQDWSQVTLCQHAAIGITGLMVISDWLASAKNNGIAWTDQITVTDLPRYRDTVRETAARFLDHLRWHSWTHPEPPTFASLHPENPAGGGRLAPRPLQTLVEQVLTQKTKPGILVVEAPTGEGKSFAGLLAAAVLSHNLGLAGFYLGLPNRMLSRGQRRLVNGVLRNAGYDLPALPVHASARDELTDDAAAAAEEAIGPRLSEVTDVEPDSLDALRWYLLNSALVYPIGVGTHDQAQNAALRSKWVFLRLAALSNKVLILDEVHTCDTFINDQLEVLMWWCGSLGTPVVIMSATLTPARRRSLIAQWQAGARMQEPSEESTPELTSQWQLIWAEADGPPEVWPLQELATPSRQVRVTQQADDLPRLAHDMLHQHIPTQGCALVILNTKRRVEEAAAAFEKAAETMPNPPRILWVHAGREDRAAIEAEIARHAGVDSPPDRHVVVIGTSLLESGIDIDADILAADLVVIDLLIQRIGRLHRHDRSRPFQHLATPTLLLIDTDHEVDEARFAGGTGIVHPSLLLRLTRREMRAHATLDFPQQAPELIRAVWGSPELRLPPEELTGMWKKNRVTRDRKEDRETYRSNRRTHSLGGDGLKDLTRDHVTRSETRSSTGEEGHQG